ncbi:transposable element Tcb1 transposase [Trichonephila clavipes]|nr:transposable element Tcb1 transposase [Trichonephila clavipes]
MKKPRVDERESQSYRGDGPPTMWKEIGSLVGRNQTNVMRICDRWMQEGTTDRRGRSHPPQCTTSLIARTIRNRLQQSGLSARRPLLGLPLTQNHRRLRRQWCDERRMMHHHPGPAQGIMIELLPWPARFRDLSPIENIWSMVAQRLTQITLPAATPDQLWQRVEAAWSAVPHEPIQSLFESMPRRVAAGISNNGGYSGY